METRFDRFGCADGPHHEVLVDRSGRGHRTLREKEMEDGCEGAHTHDSGEPNGSGGARREGLISIRYNDG